MVNEALRRALREAAGRDAEPTAGIIDSTRERVPGVKTTEVGETRGYDVGKRVKVQPVREHKIEQDHRAIEERYGHMRSFGDVDPAARFCTAYDEVRDYFRHRSGMHEVVPLETQRQQFRARLGELRVLFQAAWRHADPALPTCRGRRDHHGGLRPVEAGRGPPDSPDPPGEEHGRCPRRQPSGVHPSGTTRVTFRAIPRCAG